MAEPVIYPAKVLAPIIGSTVNPVERALREELAHLRAFHVAEIQRAHDRLEKLEARWYERLHNWFARLFQ